MKELINNYTVSEQNEQLLKRANMLVSNIKLKDGTNSQIITLFKNKDICFETIEIGVRKGLEFTENVKSVSSELFSIVDGRVKNSGIIYPEFEIS